MASFVKTKVSVTVIAVGIIVLIPLLRNNFNAPPSFTRWGKPITWDNFEGVPRIFSRYAAGISSTIFLSYDSATKQYYSYAAQNNNYSWAKPGVKDSAHHYLLGHEQYHFNISEVHARLMNNFIKANPDLDELAYKHKLYALQLELDDMQNKYDNETDHSIKRDFQRWWEYRIDSLLQNLDGNSGIITDYYSGAQIFLPIVPEQATKINPNKISFRYSGKNKYDMTLLCIVYQADTYTADLQSIELNARNMYDNLKISVRSVDIQSVDSSYSLKVIADDTINHTRLLDIWTANSTYLYRVSAELHRLNSDTIGYYRIAESFLNSFKIINTDSYWTSKLVDDTTRVMITPMVTVKAPEKYLSKTCYTIPPGEVHGFYRGPIQYNDQWLIAYDIADQPDSLINEHAIYVNNKLITFNDSSPDVLYVTPAEDPPKRPFTVAVGYVIRNDTTSGCRIMHNQKIRIE